MLLSDLVKVLKEYQTVIIVDERMVCVYNGVVSGITKLLLPKRVENISGTGVSEAVYVRIVS